MRRPVEVDVDAEAVEPVELEPQETAMVAVRVSAVDLPDFLGAAFVEVARALGEQHLGPVGPHSVATRQGRTDSTSRPGSQPPLR
jgi:hypothetical protein